MASAISVTIPTQSKITYLGIIIHASLYLVVKDNCETTLSNVQRDLARWTALSASLRSRIAVKMNIAPHVNFLSSMIPLPPPIHFWKKLDTLIRQYIWNNKQPRVKYSTLQHTTNTGGLALPNFKIYHRAFQLWALRVWMDPSSTVPWREIEQNLTGSLRLQDLAFTGVCPKTCMLAYGPIITNTLTNFKQVEEQLRHTNKWHLTTPIWHNAHLMSGNKPFACN